MCGGVGVFAVALVGVWAVVLYEDNSGSVSIVRSTEDQELSCWEPGGEVGGGPFRGECGGWVHAQDALRYSMQGEKCSALGSLPVICFLTICGLL